MVQLRLLHGWTQKQLAAAGLSASTVSRYERGVAPLPEGALRGLAGAAGASPAVLDRVLALVEATREMPRGETGGAADGRRPRIEMAATATAERQQARQLWQRLGRAPVQELQCLVEREPGLQSWALCELICGESVSQAHDSADRATQLAELAVRIAELQPAGEPLRSRLLAYAWGHVANAQRIRSQLAAASVMLHRAQRLWRSIPSSQEAPLAESRLGSFEMSLLVVQGRTEEAIELADRLLAAAGDRPDAFLLHQKGFALGIKGMGLGSSAASARRDPAALLGALRAFSQVGAMVDTQVDPVIARSAQYNRVNTLSLLGRVGEVVSALPDVRQAFLDAGHDLDLLRLDILEGSLAATVGNPEDGIEQLAQARAAYLARGMDFEAAVAGIELGELLIGSGRIAEARSLAGMADEVFGALGLAGWKHRSLGLLGRTRRS